MAQHAVSCMLLAFACALLAVVTHGCVFKYGEHPNHPMTKPKELQFTYEFAGLDWKGVCQTGTKQSPISIPSGSFGQVPEAARTILDFGQIKSNGKNIKIFNNQHVVQVEWETGVPNSKASVAVSDLKKGKLTDTLQGGEKSQRAPITPLQFHFHAHSEHSVSGAFYPLELHIVSQAKRDVLGGCTGPLGCLTVVGVVFGLADNDADSPLLKDIFDVMPLTGNKTNAFLPAGKVLDLNALLPSKKSYVTYDGSLTTPPCTEDVLWHVMLEPLTMSSRQLKQFLAATADIRCDNEKTGKAKSTIRPAAATKGTAKTDKHCKKLGAGQNYRIVQPILGRTVLAYNE